MGLNTVGLPGLGRGADRLGNALPVSHRTIRLRGILMLTRNKTPTCDNRPWLAGGMVDVATRASGLGHLPIVLAGSYQVSSVSGGAR
jgi:hypothetical protein